MRITKWILMAGLALAGAGGVANADPGYGYGGYTEPAAGTYQNGYVWVAGQWIWTQSGYQWAAGHWQVVDGGDRWRGRGDGDGDRDDRRWRDDDDRRGAWRGDGDHDRDDRRWRGDGDGDRDDRRGRDRDGDRDHRWRSRGRW